MDLNACRNGNVSSFRVSGSLTMTMHLANYLHTHQQVLMADHLFAKDIIVPQHVPSKYMDLVAVMLR